MHWFSKANEAYGSYYKEEKCGHNLKGTHAGWNKEKMA